MDITYEDFNPASLIGFRRSPEEFKAHCRRYYAKLKIDGFAPSPASPSVAVGQGTPNLTGYHG